MAPSQQGTKYVSARQDLPVVQHKRIRAATYVLLTRLRVFCAELSPPQEYYLLEQRNRC